VPEFIDPRFRENKPKTLVFSHRKREFWARFRENCVYNFEHGSKSGSEQILIDPDPGGPKTQEPDPQDCPSVSGKELFDQNLNLFSICKYFQY
jgi:hypothetical protein